MHLANILRDEAKHSVRLHHQNGDIKMGSKRSEINTLEIFRNLSDYKVTFLASEMSFFAKSEY